MERGRIEENLESVDHEMTENVEQTNHLWNALTTVNTFDQGINNNTRSTLCLNNISESQANGQVAQRLAPSSSVLIGSLIQQLCIIFEADSISRNKLYYAICDKLHELKLIDNSHNMEEYDVLRGQYQHTLYRLITVARTLTGSDSTLRVPRCLMSELSRYRREFQEISLIASGNFGKVFKALHHLDGTKYAIKKVEVPVDSIATIKQYLNEVKALAKLNHRNIVAYKAAWIEPTFLSSFIPSMPTGLNSCGSHTSSHTKESKSYSSQSSKDSHNNGSDLNFKDMHDIVLNNETSHATVSHDVVINTRFEELNSSTSIIGQRINEENSIQEHIEETNSDIVSFRNSKNSVIFDQTTEDSNYTEEDHSSPDESISPQELCTYTSSGTQHRITLYIQMALCEQTLEQWMRCRINVTPQPMIMTILQQILHGIDYMHSQNVVHHDIKPSNIFISTSGQLQIQLGDFGLACPKQRESHNSTIGTLMYAAPEQLQGKCDSKSDIYSLGIVLAELSIPTQTQMELSSILLCLKCGNIPEFLTNERYKWAQLVMRLVQKDPAKRPSTYQLLQDLTKDKDMIITELENTVEVLKNDLHDKNNTIQELKEEIALLREEVKKRHKMSLEKTVK